MVTIGSDELPGTGATKGLQFYRFANPLRLEPAVMIEVRCCNGQTSRLNKK